MVAEQAPLPRGTSRPAPGKVDGQLVYAVGDIHGCYDQLRALLDHIARDADARASGRVPSLIFCGDYVDRGPASRAVIDALCWIARHGPFAVHFLKGNHEQVMLDYLADPLVARAWMRFGGIETLASYGITAPEAEAPLVAHIAARDELLDRMPASHLRFLERLELMVGIGDYAFVHAGIRPGVALADQVPQDLMWIRDGFVDDERPHERIIVHGHTWSGNAPSFGPRRIGIDTGTYDTGVLTAIRIEDGAYDFLTSD